MRTQTLMASLALAWAGVYPALAQTTAPLPGAAPTLSSDGRTVAPLPERGAGTAPEAGGERFDFPVTWTGRTEALADAQREARAALAEARARCRRDAAGQARSKCMADAQADAARLTARARSRPASPTPLAQRPVQLLEPQQQPAQPAVQPQAPLLR